MSELALHRETWAYLKAFLPSNAVAWHTPSGEKRDKRTAARLKEMGVIPGVPDLLILHDGKLYGLELKAEKGRVSKEQEAFAAKAADAGLADYAVARSLPEVCAALQQFRVLSTERIIQ